jgi:hypothetical protein
MPHEHYAPSPTGPDHRFDPAHLPHGLPLYGRVGAAPDAPPPLRPLPGRVRALCAVLALLGGLALLLGETQVGRAEATRGWVETEAEILSAAIRSDDAGRYHLDLAYRYRAGPRLREGKRLALEPSAEREAVFAAAARYRPGARVGAWFDPAAPGSAVLERPDVPLPRAGTVAGAVLLLGALSPPGWQLLRRRAHRRARRHPARG